MTYHEATYTHPDSMRGHVAIVTGAAQGVGKGIAAALAGTRCGVAAGRYPG